MPKSDWQSLCASDIMQTNLLTVATSTPLSEVEQLLAEHNISGAPVTDETGHIVGVVSMRDLFDRYTQDPGARPRRGPGFYHLATHDLADDDFDSFEVPPEAEETAQDVMTAQVFAVPTKMPIVDVARRMLELKIHRILVTNEKKRHVGLITTHDMLRAFAG